MPEPWMPGCVKDPGTGAGYARGRNRMQMVVIHATAGTDSYNIVKYGVRDAPSTLAQWLVPLVGAPWQFTEADAICYDSPPNDDGPGIEIERPVTGGAVRPGLSEFRPMSASQLEWSGKIVQWLHTEWGVPLTLYAGPRVQGTPPGFYGFANHGDVDSQRTDGVTLEEWALMVGQGTVDEGEVEMIWKTTDDKFYVQVAGGMMQIDGGMAYVMATSGAKVCENIPPMAILKFGLDSARTLQAAMKLEFK